VLNVNNGDRIVTYAIEAPAGSGTVSLRGVRHCTGQVGDTVIVMTYAVYWGRSARLSKARPFCRHAKPPCGAAAGAAVLEGEWDDMNVAVVGASNNPGTITVIRRFLLLREKGHAPYPVHPTIDEVAGFCRLRGLHARLVANGAVLEPISKHKRQS
jgi:hypothetical protein